MIVREVGAVPSPRADEECPGARLVVAFSPADVEVRAILRARRVEGPQRRD